MKTRKNNPVVCICSIFILCTSLLLLFVVQMQGVCVAAETSTVTEADDALTYMMEVDALKLNGTVSNVRDWNENDDSWLTGEYFEPIVVTVDVRNHGGQCFGEHDFYLKKGVETEGLESGALVMFHINKNMCHPNKALIIMDLHVLQSKGGR